MKLLSNERKQYQMRISRQRISELQAENREAGLRRRRRAKGSKRNKGKRYGWLDCPVPPHLRFHGAKFIRDRFTGFVNDVEELLTAGRKVRLDFRKTRLLFPCGLLLFIGWLDSWLERFPGKLWGQYPEDDRVEQMLQFANVIQRLGLAPRKVITHDDVVRWHKFEGQTVDATPMAEFMEEVRARATAQLQVGLGDCVAEAMTNVKNHAYSPEIPARWWMFATINGKDNQVFVAMYDRGDSIPGTLLAKPGIGDVVTLRTVGRRGGDAEVISHAVGGRSRTRLSYRGKGLPEMLEFTRSHPDNDLAIYSRRGFFIFNGKTKDERKGTLQQPVVGTLVIWLVSLSGGAS